MGSGERRDILEFVKPDDEFVDSVLTSDDDAIIEDEKADDKTSPPAPVARGVATRPTQARQGPRKKTTQRPFKGVYLRLVRANLRAVEHHPMPARVKGDYLSPLLASRWPRVARRPRVARKPCINLLGQQGESSGVQAYSCSAPGLPKPPPPMPTGLPANVEQCLQQGSAKDSPPRMAPKTPPKRQSSVSNSVPQNDAPLSREGSRSSSVGAMPSKRVYLEGHAPVGGVRSFRVEHPLGLVNGEGQALQSQSSRVTNLCLVSRLLMWPRVNHLSDMFVRLLPGNSTGQPQILTHGLLRLRGQKWVTTMLCRLRPP